MGTWEGRSIAHVDDSKTFRVTIVCVNIDTRMDSKPDNFVWQHALFLVGGGGQSHAHQTKGCSRSRVLDGLQG